MFQKLSAIPLSAFCGPETKKQFEKYIRFCFIKVNLHPENQCSTESCKRLTVTFFPGSLLLNAFRNRNFAWCKIQHEVSSIVFLLRDLTPSVVGGMAEKGNCRKQLDG